MRSAAACLAALVLACGGSPSTPTGPTAGPTSPSAPAPAPAPAPSPTPTPAPSGFSGVVTNTVTGALINNFTASISGARLIVSAPGFITRDTRVGAVRVDLIPESGFSLQFYRMLARDTADPLLAPPKALQLLSLSPSFYMETEGPNGFSKEIGAALEVVARRIVPQLTGGVLQVQRWETGPTPRPRQNGWIVVERRELGGRVCGQAFVGATAGQILLDADPLCSLEATMAHEIGHALGFWHVNISGSLMFPQIRGANVNDAPTERELHHAAIAYKRVTGNRDVDVDP
jgi:Matrixin